MSKRDYYLVSLGCAKNMVDSESMASLLNRAGYKAVDDPARAAFLIVNTCGFIQAARDESIQTLREMAAGKRRGQMLVAAGCLTERYRQRLAQEVPGIDGMLSTRRWMDIVGLIGALRDGSRPEPFYNLPENPTVGWDEAGAPRSAIQGGSAYLKVADGCRRPCAFCSIPLIKGTAVSRPIEAIIDEAATLQQNGVREVILIAQDTTDYGHDLGMKDGLAVLLEGIQRTAPGLDWLRIMYAYPGYVTDRLIDVMAGSRQVLPYLDMPLQHAHPGTLRRMKRPANMDWVHRTLAKMRQTIPNLALRTTFIVGYPGETEAEFQALLDFVKEMRFDHVGTFTFSFEPGTASEQLGDPVPAEVKEERRERLMLLQEQISLEKNQALIGKTLPVLIEGADNDLSIGRTYRDAPEIDGLAIVEGLHPAGEIIPVRITGALTHDVTGVAAHGAG